MSVCLNKIDMLRPNDKEKMVQVAKTRLHNPYVIETAFDPDPRLSQDGPIGAQVVFDWVVEQLTYRPLRHQATGNGRT